MAQDMGNAGRPAGCSAEVNLMRPADYAAFVPKVMLVTPRGTVLRTDPDVLAVGLPARRCEPLEVLERRMLARMPERSRQPIFTGCEHTAAAAWLEVEELVARGNMRGVDLDASSGGGGPAGLSEAVLCTLSRWRRMRERLEREPGKGRRMVLRAEGAAALPGRRSIAATVAMGCILRDGLSVSEVMERHGWQPTTPCRKRFMQGFRAALTAIYGL